MSKDFEFKITDNSKMFIAAKNERVRAALTAVGIQAVSHVQRNYTANGRVDTGLLRNSIAYAISGEQPSTDSYSGTTGQKTGRPGSKGAYNGTVPADEPNKPAVYVGTNVDYALYIEEGTRNNAGTHDIKSAMTDNLSEYKGIFKKVLQSGEK